MNAAALLLALSVTLTSAASATAVTTLRILEPSNVTLSGSSNVNQWRCVGTTIRGTFELPASRSEALAHAAALEKRGGSATIDDAIGRASRFDLVIPVRQLDCGNPIMESDLRRTLRSREHPEIRFNFERLAGDLLFDRASGLYQARIAGTISLAGTAREIVVDLRGRRSGDRVRLRATIPARMTTFGIEPPTALFGAVRANDSLQVAFDLLLEMGTDATAVGGR